MTTQNYEHAAAFITALTGDINTPMAWRAISDIKGDGRDPKVWFAPLATVWNDLVAYNAARYGIFAIINATDGLGREAQNVTGLRANWVDLDKGDIVANRAKVVTWSVPPHILVNSSATGKAHAYWLEKPWNDPVAFSELQRKLIATFGGDPVINDTPRVMRIPGFLHGKTETPWLVTMEAGPAWGKDRIDVALLASSLAGVVVEAGGGTAQNELGDPRLAAPSFEWATRALEAIDPSGLEYDEWRDVTFAFKQAIWSHTNEFIAKTIWDAWNRKSAKFEHHESEKLWRSAKAPRMGWPGLLKRSGMKAQMMFGPPGGQVAPVGLPLPGEGQPVQVVMNAPGPDDERLGVFLTGIEQATYFAGCTYVVSLNEILVPNGMFLDSSQFNSVFGGKAFQIKQDGPGMTTDEAWKAATRGQLFKVPQVHFTRFLPSQPIDKPFVDEFGRLSVNTYRPANIAMREGDPTLFVQHMRNLLPTENDVLIFLSYLAHCVQRPGSKAKWAPLLQSAEGAGKGIIKEVMLHAMGRSYVHAPNARELGEGGGKFNGWMEGKLLIVADEIRVDERRDMIEVLKPMITETTLEIQRKGVDQVVGDNVSNWIMFSNYKDAIPINNNSRRFAIFYSPLQTLGDLNARGMGENDPYFPTLWGWLEAGGYEIVTHYLKHFQIPAHLDPAVAAHRAPLTSSHAEALRESRGQYEQRIADAIDEGRQGFRGGWVSSWAVAKLLGGKVAPRTISKAIEAIGYVQIGRSTGAILLEDMSKPTLYNLNPNESVQGYAAAQGYGV